MTTTVAAPSQVLRRLAIGDSWRYDVVGSLTSGAKECCASGTIAVTVEPDGPQGAVLVFQQTLRVGDAALPEHTGIFAFTQDARTGDLSLVGDNMGPGGTRRRALRPQLFYPGRWSVTTGYDNQLDFGDGAFVRNTLAVTGREDVVTKLGTYPAWIAQFSSEGSAMGRLAGTDWWAPDLGAPVRFASVATTPDGDVMQLTANLLRVDLTGLGAA